MADATGPQLLRLGRKPEEGLDLSLDEQFEGVDPIGGGHPANVVRGVEPDLSRHQLQQFDGGCPEANRPALQVGNVANALPGEKFQAADIDAR